VQCYLIFAQQGYPNPREANGRIVCANPPFRKPVELEVPQSEFFLTVLKRWLKSHKDKQIKTSSGYWCKQDDVVQTGLKSFVYSV
jgi:apocytochrome f